MSNEILHGIIQNRFKDFFNDPPDIPPYIYKNLSHELRPYQEHALRHFIYTQRSDAADISFNHLLFHMATGSGKTLILATAILYLFKEKGHQNFIFFVNRDAIIKKTAYNLTDTSSSKYLFNKEGIVIDNEIITIQIVDVFPTNAAKNTIYLKLTTIDKLHSDLSNPKENGLTYESLEGLKLVLLGDEAHHFNVLTKSDKKKLTAKEVQERTWENTVNQLLRLNHQNRLLEFTATIDLSKDALFNKYQNKIVYQYDLKQFMTDGFSKNVVLLRSNEDDERKMLHSVLLSQYRKYVSRDHGILLKPIILFKSNKIEVSLNAENTFLHMIENLSMDQLDRIVKQGLAVYQNTHSIWHNMFLYYSRKNLEEVIRDLQWDFKNETIINANDSDFKSENKVLLLNTLEDLNNPIRAVFGVAKLNEGWDVLNLYDIVRISEGATKTKAVTDSEAQLIGRGARYYPFVYKGEKSYVRRFDFEGDELKALESLHYHTINESAYIKNLEKSLEAAQIQVKEDKYERLEAKIKPQIRKLDLFKNAKIYINRLIPTTPDDYQTFDNYNVSHVYDTKYETSIEQIYGSKRAVLAETRTHEEQLPVNKTLLRKAIQRNPFFRFSNLKEYVPAITSINEFLDSTNFLGDLTINVSLPISISIEDLTPKEKLGIVERFMSYAGEKIRLNYQKQRGTPVFQGISFFEVFDDYVINMSKVNNSITYTTQIVKVRNMRDHDWYIYDKAIVDGLEDNFINFIIDYMDNLKEKYEDVYLIRNQKAVKLIEIGGSRGFEPDFLLYLKSENITYQVFLEPKGDHLREKDGWKQAFLLSLSENPEVEVLSENEEVRLLGIKFYSDQSDYKQEFREDFKTKLL